MKTFAALSVAALMIFANLAQSAPTNIVTPPACYSDVESFESLPIFVLEVVTTTDLGDGVFKLSPGRGSVFLANKNFWVTASHVIDDGEITRAEIHIDNGTHLTAELVYFNVENHVAILYADSGDMVPLNLLTIPLTQYEAIWNVGYPAIVGEALVSYEGSSLQVAPSGYLISNGLALPGMSGGPQFRCREGILEVAGIVTAYTTEYDESTEIQEDGTKIIYRNHTNSGGSVSTPNVVDYVLAAMIKRLEDLDLRQAEIKENIETIQSNP